MSILYKPVDAVHYYRVAAKNYGFLRTYRATPFIITFCDTVITEFDIQNFIELGLRIIRFKITDLTKEDKLKLLAMLSQALKWCCQKYNVSTWPVAVNIDIPNAVIKTGFISKELPNRSNLMIQENSIVVLTSDTKYWAKCDTHRIYMDDPYTLPYLVPGTEIAIDFGSIIMTAIEKIDDKNIKCKVLRGGPLNHEDFLCTRGIRHIKPILTTKDIEIIEFAKECKFDIITINSVRSHKTVLKVRSLFSDPVPLIVSTICEQEGLDNIDAIIKASDAIILAREFLAHEITEQYRMISIQLQVNAKCKKYGKPFYISGNIMENILLMNNLTGCDLNDITNAVLQGSGIMLRKFREPKHLNKAMRLLNDVCEAAEPLTQGNQFWRLSMEYQIPANAAEAAVLSSVLLAKITHSMVIIIPTVTGRTVKQVAHMASDAIILAITSNATVARQLQLYRGVIAIIYEKKSLRNWDLEMDARIRFAVEYGIKFEVLHYGGNYVILRKKFPTSSFCDTVISFQAYTEEELNRLELNIRRKKKLE